MSLGAHSAGDDGPAAARPRTLRRRLLAALLSLVLVLAGIGLIAVGALVAIVAVQQAVEAKISPALIVPCLAVVVGLAIILGGARFITRVRPWLIRRLCRCEVPRIAAPIRAMASGDGWDL